eukprot:TRINITY_DN72555_c0_g1_i1.p1 TRINITY_DN72555_c0_g1~~TRINITY_DN72555_c0_g1_i1.p1  ORF type:complete len:267 (+),score=50.27 TRINITY_DN72555_c0_g1_i1:83-802(+)
MAPRPPLDKRQDFGRICGVAGLLCMISGIVNGVALFELGAPVGYTSGHCVNLGRFLASGDAAASKIAGAVGMYYAGGILAGAAGAECDSIFEGRASLSMLLSAVLLAVGTLAKRSLNRPVLTMQVWALSQGLLNAIATRFSATPLRATHTAGGQTDAAITLGQALVALKDGRSPPALRKVALNAVCCLGMIFGGFAAGRGHKRWGSLTALVPAAMLALTATALPRAIAPPADDQNCRVK